MATTLQFDSFTDLNIRERSALSGDVLAGAESIPVESTEGFSAGDIIYIGNLSREGCEKAVIDAVTNETTLALTSALGLPHSAYEPVTSVLGDKIQVYRASNVDGTVPDSFTLLATREIDPDQTSTYYRDPDGSSSYWYYGIYYNATSEEESARISSPFRGDDFGHYTSIAAIRTEAGFERAYNLKDSTIDQQRRAAESIINAKLAATYTTPFDPVPEAIRTFTTKLAAAMLLVHAYGSTYEKRVKALMEELETMGTLTDDEGNQLTTNDSFTGYPGGVTDDAPRMFRMGDRY